MAMGSAAHITSGWLPARIANTPPITTPITLPISACTVVRPVPSAVDRRTWSVPSTTQNAWDRPSRRATSTASARPTATRRLFCITVDVGSRWVRMVRTTRVAVPRTPSRRGAVIGRLTVSSGCRPAAITALVPRATAM